MNRHRIRKDEPTPDYARKDEPTPDYAATPDYADTGLRPRVVGQPVIVSHNWASMNFERWAMLSVATVTVSLGPTDN